MLHGSAVAEAGRPLVKVNPRHARRFGEALGARATTDRADAVMLERMGLASQLEPRPVETKGLRDPNDLIAVRRALVNDRTAAKNRAKGIGLAILRRQNADRLKRIGTNTDTLVEVFTETRDHQIETRHLPVGKWTVFKPPNRRGCSTSGQYRKGGVVSCHSAGDALPFRVAAEEMSTVATRRHVVSPCNSLRRTTG